MAMPLPSRGGPLTTHLQNEGLNFVGVYSRRNATCLELFEFVTDHCVTLVYRALLMNLPSAMLAALGCAALAILTEMHRGTPQEIRNRGLRYSGIA
ncbi:hypothetical protein Pelo_10892 [Pelomyxa schiedti]|nr:hypothetical protein Pelo_10892 [Pelomyxa schiedti]